MTVKDEGHKRKKGYNYMENKEKSVRGQIKTGKRQEKKIGVYLSNEDHALFMRASERAGLSVSSWMRAVCLREAREAECPSIGSEDIIT